MFTMVVALVFFRDVSYEPEIFIFFKTYPGYNNSIQFLNEQLLDQKSILVYRRIRTVFVHATHHVIDGLVGPDWHGLQPCE